MTTCLLPQGAWSDFVVPTRGGKREDQERGRVGRVIATRRNRLLEGKVPRGGNHLLYTLKRESTLEGQGSTLRRDATARREMVGSTPWRKGIISLEGDDWASVTKGEVSTSRKGITPQEQTLNERRKEGNQLPRGQRLDKHLEEGNSSLESKDKLGISTKESVP